MNLLIRAHKIKWLKAVSQWKLEIDRLALQGVFFYHCKDCYAQLSRCYFFDTGHALGIHVDSVITLPFCRQCFLSSLQSASISPIHYEEVPLSNYSSKTLRFFRQLLFIHLLPYPLCAFSFLCISWTGVQGSTFALLILF